MELMSVSLSGRRRLYGTSALGRLALAASELRHFVWWHATRARCNVATRHVTASRQTLVRISGIGLQAKKNVHEATVVADQVRLHPPRPLLAEFTSCDGGVEL